MERIVTALFPEHPLRLRAEFERLEDVPLFSNEELETAVLSLNANKAPGPDGIPGDALKKVIIVKPDLLLRTYNTCLSEGVFPLVVKRPGLYLSAREKMTWICCRPTDHSAFLTRPERSSKS